MGAIANGSGPGPPPSTGPDVAGLAVLQRHRFAAPAEGALSLEPSERSPHLHPGYFQDDDGNLMKESADMTRAAALIALLLPLCAASASASERYFLGEIVAEINGQFVRHARVWKCEKRTIFRPVHTLFEQVWRRTELLDNSFAVRFGVDSAMVVGDWDEPCETGNTRRFGHTRVSLIDRVSAPSVGEELSLVLGATPTRREALTGLFSTRLLRDGVSEIDEPRYQVEKAASDRAAVDSASLMYRLREKAAYQLAVRVLTWRDADKIAWTEHAALQNGKWTVEGFRLTADPSERPRLLHDTRYGHFAVRLFPLGSSKSYGRPDLPETESVGVGGRQVEVGWKLPSELLKPEPGLRTVWLIQQRDFFGWAGGCTSRPARFSNCPPMPD